MQARLPDPAPTSEAATRADAPPASAHSGFERVWRGLDIVSATIDQLSPGGTLAPRRPTPDTSRRDRVARLPRVAVARSGDAADGPQADLEMGRELGAGGMGVVQAAIQLSLDREVAVKTVRRDAPNLDAAAAELVREARIAGRLEHPNILPIHALGQDDRGAPLLVMKKVAGTVWRDLIAADPPWPGGQGDPRSDNDREGALIRHLLILLQVCNAVAYAHSRGVVHRDLKTDNVMVGAFGEVYVLDWGVAVDLARPDATGTGIAGTPCWMAPEMVESTADGIGVHTDVYLLGGLLHAILTGAPRHAGGDIYQVLYAAFASEPAVYPDHVPAPLARLCNRATARDVAERVPSVEAFRAELELFLRHRDSLKLADEASLRLADLQRVVEVVLPAGADGLADDAARLVHRLGGEARFGFQQALATWPDNPLARDGYQSVCATMARVAVAEGDARTAGHLIAEIADPPAALVAGWQALTAARASDAFEVQRLRAIERDFDFEATSGTRSRLALAIAVVWAIVPLAFGVLEQGGVLRLTYPGYLGAGLFWAAFVGGAVWWWRRELITNRVNRAFVRSLAGAVAAPLLQRTVSWQQGLSIHDAMTQDMVLFFLVLLGMAATIDWRLAWGAGVYGLSASVAAVWPQWSLFVLAFANLIGLGTVAAVWSPRVRSETRRAAMVAHLQEVHACIGIAAWQSLRAAARPVARAVPAVAGAVGLK